MNTITFLKNKLMLFASIIFCIQCFAQNPEFKFYLAFEDSAGNKDTIWLGYDSSATLGIDTLFGEENIKGIPFNEPFEVRISNDWFLCLMILYLTRQIHLAIVVMVHFIIQKHRFIILTLTLLVYPKFI